MNIQLLRNATQILKINGKSILIDPMLGEKGSYDPIPNTGNTLRNPLVDLPITEPELKQLIDQTDAVLLTHLHRDHWDLTAQQLLPKDMMLFCQPADLETVRQTGFINAHPIADEFIWEDIRFNRTGGQHGTGLIGERMGMVSGYVIRHQGNVLYLAGDTIWCKEVCEALDKYKPTHIILNGGGARFQTGDPIVMNVPDVITVCNYAVQAQIIIVHLEAVNHSTESRIDIKAALKAHGFSGRCVVPENGESISLKENNKFA